METLTKIVAVALVAGGASQSVHAATVVDLELSLVVDVSGSVNTTEFNLQRDGYEAAFRDASVINAIANQTNGIAVNLVYFASSAVESVSFAHIVDSASANAFADLIAAAGRPSSGTVGSGTDIAEGIDLGVSSLNSNMFSGTRNIIDVSGDGVDSSGGSVLTARTNALNSGIDGINGLAIGDQSLANYFASNVQGGSNAFTVQAVGFDSFSQAAVTKIGTEITGIVPTPTAALASLAMLGGLSLRRRRS